MVDDQNRAVRRLPDPLAGNRAAQWIRWIHDGSRGGPVWRFIVFLTGVFPVVFAFTGLLMWWRGRRARKRVADAAGGPRRKTGRRRIDLESSRPAASGPENEKSPIMQMPASLWSAFAGPVLLRQRIRRGRVLLAGVGGSRGARTWRSRRTCRAISRPWGMYQAADWVVKSVMIGLLFASVVTWTVWLAKSIELLCRQAHARPRFEAVLASARSLDDAARELGKTKGPFGEFVRAAIVELQMSGRGHGPGRNPGAHRVAARANRDCARPRHHPRHRRAGDDRLDRAVRRTVRHGLGHHEQLHRNLEGADDQSCGGRARHCRGVARDRLRSRRRHPGGGDLQRVLAADRRLSRAAGRCVGRDPAAGQPRS